MASVGDRIVFQAPVGIRSFADGSRNDVDRVEAVLDALRLLAQQQPQHDDAGIRMRQIFERVERDRALPLLGFEIVGLALPLLVAAFQERARPDVRDGVERGR